MAWENYRLFKLSTLRGIHVFLLLILVGCVGAGQALAQAPVGDDLLYHREKDVIYGRSYGTALTLDVITPRENANGYGVIWVISGGYVSSPDAIHPQRILASCGPLLRRGYTVFAVVHGSQPKFTIPEAVKDMNRATRFVRHHAETYGISPERIGIYGGSAGGQLALMQAIAAEPPDPRSPDPVERESSAAQVAATFFPATDFLNYGEHGRINLGTDELAFFRAAFDFVEYDRDSRRLLRITDEEKRKEIGRRLSPVYSVSPDDAPTLIIHGDADVVVPIQQARVLIEALTRAGVPAELITRQGAGHGWPGIEKDVEIFANWFDLHLRGLAPL